MIPGPVFVGNERCDRCGTTHSPGYDLCPKPLNPPRLSELAPPDIVERLRAGTLCLGLKCRSMDARSGCECAEAADEIERLRAERQWCFDMEKAPRDGSHVLVVAGDAPQAVYEAFYEEDNDLGWYQSQTHWTDNYDGQLWNVTAWMPIPNPPQEGASTP